MKLIKFVVTCLLGVSLIACQEKIRQEEDILSKPSPEENIEKDFIPLFEAEMALSEDQLKAFQVGFDELSNTTGDQSKIFSPRIKFRPETLDNVELLLRRKKGEEVKFFRERVTAEVILVDNQGKGSSNKARVRIWIRKPNAKKNNLPFTFEEGETWHAMIIMNSDNKTITDKNGKQVAVFGEEEEDKKSLNRSTTRIVQFVGRNPTAGSGDKDAYRVARYGQEVGRHSIPLISNWKELIINSDAKHSHDVRIPLDSKAKFRLANGVGFVIKPQGLLLHYQIVANVFEGIDMRRAGIVSNVFDFQGKYLLDEENLKKAFDEKDTDGFGIPAWEGQESELKNFLGFNMYKAPSDDYLLGFPWDMPKIYDVFEPAGSGQVGQRMAETYKESDISMALFYGYRPSDEYRGKFVGMAVGLTTPRTASTYDDPPGNYPDVANHIQWAIPKKSVPAKPFTYLWINAHSAHNQDGYYTSKKSITELFPGKDPDEYDRFLKQKNVRSQPMVVVHQTNATFGHQLGKAPRLHAMITTDLMITELTYKEDSGKNYSVVELQNPSKLDINLNEYALVRLRFDGNKMSYLRTDNTFTDRLEDLSDGDFYFLKDLKESDMVSIYKPNNDQVSVEYGAKESAYAGKYVGSVNRYFNKFEENGKKLLAAGQVVLIGASGYEIKNSHLELKSWWPTFFPRDPRYNSWYLAQKRFRYFARTSHSNVLDINSGNNTQVKDGLALVKLFTTQQGEKKKVIDTTAPIGSSDFGFSGTLYNYKQEFNKVATITSYYSQKRKDGVVFPFMAPYRTKRVETDSWSDDWELLVNRNDLGYRWLASIDGAGPISGGRTMNLHRYRYFAKERTPLGQPDKYMSSRPEQR